MSDGVSVVIYFKTIYNTTIIRFDFYDVRNNQGLGKRYWAAKAFGSAADTYLNLDYANLRTADAFLVVASIPPKKIYIFLWGREATSGNASAVRRLWLFRISQKTHAIIV